MESFEDFLLKLKNKIVFGKKRGEEKEEKKIIIGIPRALYYWKQPYFWESFLKRLGMEVLVSPQTNKEIVSEGTKAADPETCFAIKVLYGHILWLAKQNVDYIFVPRMKSLRKNFMTCPKFFGLPDLAKILTKVNILSPLIDLNKKSFKKSVFETAYIFFQDFEKTDLAFQEAKKTLEEYEKKLFQDYNKKIRSEKPKIVVISHPYNLYDDYINLHLLDRLERLGAEVITIDSVPIEETKELSIHWDFAEEILGQTKGSLNIPKIAGAIEISSFQCGCDAVLREFIEKRFKKNNIPFLYLLVDEHTAEAGLQTRLEAFIDTLNR